MLGGWKLIPDRLCRHIRLAALTEMSPMTTPLDKLDIILSPNNKTVLTSHRIFFRVVGFMFYWQISRHRSLSWTDRQRCQQVNNQSHRCSTLHDPMHFIYLRQRGGKCVCPRSFVCLHVCLSVCLLAKLLKNAFVDLDEMLRVDRCRDMGELINFSARSGL